MGVLPRPRNGLSLCAGGGGLDMGLGLAEPGFHTRAYVEYEPYPQQVLVAAQRAGYFAPAPIWDDLTTFDAKPLAGAIDTLLAGYPCQPFSAAGKRLGEADPRHLWPHVARVATELGDGLRWIFLENVAGHITLGAESVLRTLWDMGFTPAAGAFSAAETGAPHERLRWFCVAYRENTGSSHRGERRKPFGVFAKPSGFHGNLADPHGGNPGAERERSSREQRFQPEGGGTGRGDVVHPGRAERGQSVATGNDADREEEERRQSPDRPEQSGDDMDDASHGGRGIHTGPGPEGGGTPDAGGARRDMADASGARTEAWGAKPQRGQQGNATEPFDHSGPLFPPGPGDRGAWAVVLAANPDRAPSFARRDAVAAAVNLASLLLPDKAEAIEPRLRGLPRGALMAAVVREAPELVDETQALARLRNLADGLAHRTRALRLLGNGVCPLQAAYAWRTLASAHGLGPVDLEAAGGDEADDATRSVRRVM
jgi:site-specific DNA-cytosine methylase